MALFLRRTLLSGMFVILPVGLLVTVPARSAMMIYAGLEPIARRLPLAPLFPGPWVNLWAVLVLLTVCFITGLVITWRPLRALVAAVDGSIAGVSWHTRTCAVWRTASWRRAEASEFEPSLLRLNRPSFRVHRGRAGRRSLGSILADVPEPR
jgi:hypothetical protein